MAIETYGKRNPKRDFKFNHKYLFYGIGALILLGLFITLITNSRGVERVSLEDSIYETVDESNTPVEDSSGSPWVTWVTFGYIIFMVIVIISAKLMGATWDGD